MDLHYVEHVDNDVEYAGHARSAGGVHGELEHPSGHIPHSSSSDLVVLGVGELIVPPIRPIRTIPLGASSAHEDSDLVPGGNSQGVECKHRRLVVGDVVVHLAVLSEEINV